MKTKFESNVATQIPKTKMAHEPQLPWELSKYDLQESESLEDTTQSVIIGQVPFGIRPAFLITLLVVIFLGTSYVFVGAVKENEKVHMDILKKERVALMLRAGLEKTINQEHILR